MRIANSETSSAILEQFVNTIVGDKWASLPNLDDEQLAMNELALKRFSDLLKTSPNNSIPSEGCPSAVPGAEVVHLSVDLLGPPLDLMGEQWKVHVRHFRFAECGFDGRILLGIDLSGYELKVILIGCPFTVGRGVRNKNKQKPS